ncbi:MAG: response regulator transcription factor [Bacteroidales bacterium]|nr:response regulator transcription factor [Bacteroidales bacterium]
MNKIKVLLVDDHQIITNGIQVMLEKVEEIVWLGSTNDAEDALRLVKLMKPDILITDISMPKLTGIEITKLIKKEKLHTRVLILTMYTFEDFIFNAIQAGANGVLSKQDTTREVLLEAIHVVHQGNDYFSPSVSRQIMHVTAKNMRLQSTPDLAKIPALTLREKEILRLYVEGFTNHEIGEKLCISPRTVETHKNNIMQKFNFKSTVEMVKYALRNNLVLM